MVKRKRRSSAEQYLLLAAIAISIIILIFIFASSANASDASYDFLSPTVYQGQPLEGSDFIGTKSFIFGCRSTLLSDADTSVAGTFTATLRIDGNGGYTRAAECQYTVLPAVRDCIYLEAGFTSISPEDIVVPGVPADVMLELDPHATGAMPRADVPGEYEVSVRVGKYDITVPVSVSDTIPPSAEPQTVTITNDSGTPAPEDFVTNIVDATEVRCQFAEEYVYDDIEVFDVTVILTDAAGNTASVTATADCRVDHTPPTLDGLDDLFVTVGGAVSYRSGVTAEDNSGGSVTYTVSADGVDYNTTGEYFVTYIATDEAGNSAEFSRRLYVVEELPPDKDVVLAAASEVYAKIVDDGMSKWDIAYAIFRYTHNNITYTGVSDKTSWLKGAYDGFNTHGGDCFTYMAVARALFEVADIPYTVVERDRREGETRHYWLLVDIGDGWYHFDACSRRLCPSFVAFMRTDAELQWYRDKYDEHYYRFDPDAYPERAENSYYSSILQSPTEINP